MTPLSAQIGHLAWVQLWQVTLVAAGVGLATRLFCRRRPYLAYVLWMLVLVKSLTPPLWASPTSLFSWASAFAPVTVLEEMAGAPSVEDEMARSYGPRGGGSSTGELVAGAGSAGIAEAHGTARKSASAAAGTVPSSFTVTSALGLVWLCGAAMSALCILISAAGLRREILKSQAPVDASLTALVERIRQRLRVRRRVRLIVVREPIGPLAFGWLRPTIVLPGRLVSSHSREELEPLVAHELVHVRRNDALVALGQSVVQCLWWFHPLLWWANRRIIDERERCCDEAVIAGLDCQPGRYARSLLDVLEWKWQSRWLAPVPGMRSFEINKRRLEHLLRHPGRFRDAMSRRDWLFLFVGLLVLIPGAGMTRSRAAPAVITPPVRGAADLREKTPASQGPAEAAKTSADSRDENVPVVKPDGALEPQEAPRGPLIEIYAMNVDGTNARRVADIPGFPIINSPEISPDGKWVAVDGWTWDQNLRDAHLLLVNLETAQVKDLGIGAMPTWSADGLWIACSKYRPNGGVFIREVDGAAERLIDPDGWGIQWAPDGLQLAYGRSGNIVVYDLRANAAREVFPAGACPYESIYWNSKWSPDSKRICFKGRRPGGTIDIAIVSATGGDPDLRVVCDGQDYNEDIGWHPDGQRVTIPRKVMPGQPGQIYEFNPDEIQPPALLAGQPRDRNNGGMCFSHDGKTFYFMSYK
jgi:beta-lactamase regulating signal transducer with metallopeptidase domain